MACIGTIALGVVLASACEVTNPGPIQDQYLGDETSQAPLVRGAHRQLVVALNDLIYHAAVVAREILPSGETTGGVTPQMAAGELRDDQTEGSWSDLQQSRFIAEDAVARFEEAGGVNPAILAEGYIWAGFANRVLGELYCEVTFDGGPIQPGSAALERAEGYFTDAIGVAPNANLRQAAYAGRAQARAGLGDWTGAASDAQEVDDDFAFFGLTDGAEIPTRNNVYWSIANLPYRLFTMHFTTYYDYYATTGDPRVAWLEDPAFPEASASLTGYGKVPWSYPTKYLDVDAPYRVASGAEMLLIRAEAALAAGQPPADALALINQLRTSYASDDDGMPLDGYTAGTATEVWAALKQERAIELFLEGRRLHDIRRWEDAGRPGDPWMPDFESVSDIFTSGFDRCFPISQTEKLTNPNINAGG